MNIALCSTSSIKLASVHDAVARIWPDAGPNFASVRPDASTSGVPPQPFGHMQILTGALNRAHSVAVRYAGANYQVVAIESGIATFGNAFVDIAYVVVLTPDAQIVVRSSRRILVPTELVIRARESNWETTCGQLEAARNPGVDQEDPHVAWSGRTTNRRELLSEAVEDALRFACGKAPRVEAVSP